jgi:pimeloyl-ACP methyl ester carboxylesterase
VVQTGCTPNLASVALNLFFSMKTKDMLQNVRRNWPYRSQATLNRNRTAQAWLRGANRNLRFPGREAQRGAKSSALAAGVAVGAALGTIALLVRRAARQAEERHPPIGRFLEVEGVRLHYLESGAGEPVVLLHGNGTHAGDFVGSGLMEALARRYRVVAFDRPGFGYSQRPRWRVWTPAAQASLLREAFAQLGITRPVIVAHSWAALVALALALRHPESVRGLLLVSGYYYPSLRLDALFQSPPAIPLLGDLMRYTVSPLLGRWLLPLQVRRAFAPERVPAAFQEQVPLEMMLRPWQLRAGAAEAALMNPAARALARHFGEIQLPVTLMAGTEDEMVDHRAHAARLHGELPHSHLLLMAGRGHMLHYSETEALTGAVDELFAEPAARGRASAVSQAPSESRVP